jgi:nucleotide-binding universal stress UspA family protein
MSQRLAFTAMTTAPPPTQFVHLVVGYDGSPPASRALDAAVRVKPGAIVVGSSSHATHRVVGSVAIGLARHSPVPLIIVP